MTWSDYAEDYEGRIIDLHKRLHCGSYRAQPSKRAYIAKSDGKQRPLGIAAVEDKIVQAAVANSPRADLRSGLPRVQLWLSSSRRAHDALDEVYVRDQRQKDKTGFSMRTYAVSMTTST